MTSAARDLTYDVCSAKRAGGYACIRDGGHHGPHYYRDAQGRWPIAPRLLAIDKCEAAPRKALVLIMARQGNRVTLAALSRMLDRPSGYLGRFVADGVPAALRCEKHARLADFFGIDQRALGVRDLWRRA